ncbi:hypothetical protein V7166_13075 [Bacillus thuringiensis]
MQIKINEYRLPMAELGPYGITVGVDRALWFTEHKGNRIGRMTITGEMQEFSVPTSDALARLKRKRVFMPIF